MTRPRELQTVAGGSGLDAGRPRVNELLVLALRASSGRHAEAARNVVLTILFLQLLAGAGHDGPPHAAMRAPRRGPAPRPRHPRRATVTGRRPRG